MTVYAIRDKRTQNYWYTSYDELTFVTDTPYPEALESDLEEAKKNQERIADERMRPLSDFEIIAFTLTEQGPVTEGEKTS